MKWYAKSRDLQCVGHVKKLGERGSILSMKGDRKRSVYRKATPIFSSVIEKAVNRAEYVTG